MVSALGLAESVARFDRTDTALAFWKQEQLAVLPDFLSASAVARIVSEVEASQHCVVRKHVWGYKNSGSISYPALLRETQSIARLYKSPQLIDFFSRLADMPLVTCGDDDPHACAVYQYEQPGDRVGFHYDTSWYAGARFTVLLGLVDAPSVRLHCRVHSRDQHRPTQDLEINTAPGTLVFFNGDKLLHRVTPLGSGERRVVLTMQYVSSRYMHPVKRVVSNLKDALTYFGLGMLKQPPKRSPARLGEASVSRRRQP
jgi:hypothetical protein